MTRPRHLWMALAYLLAAGIPAYQTIRHTDREVQYLKETYDANNFQNNGTLKEVAFWKEMTAKHHFLGPLIDRIFAPSIDRQFQLPPLEEAQEALDKIPGLIELKKNESTTALLWSLSLFMMSLIYLALAITPTHPPRPDPIFALTVVSVAFLAVGVTAPAMVIVVSPATPYFPHFILHYEIRSVLGVILVLYKSRYWFVGACLTLFSVLIPLVKAGLTVFVLESASLSRKLKIAKFLHSISKWSMADVFVAAIILSNFAVKANKSTQADLFLGFYYFLGYCLLSMLTTTLLENKVQGRGKKIGLRHGRSRKAPR